MKASPRFFGRFCPLSNPRQLFHPNHANTVGERNIHDLTADFVILILHPARLFTADFANHLELFGFAQRSPQSRIASAHKGALVPFEKPRFHAHTSHGDIAKPNVNAHHLCFVPWLHVKGDRDHQIPFRSLFVEVSWLC